MKKILFLLLILLSINLIDATVYDLNISLDNPLNNAYISNETQTFNSTLNIIPNTTFFIYDDFEDSSVNLSLWSNSSGDGMSEASGKITSLASRACGPASGTDSTTVISTNISNISSLQSLYFQGRINTVMASGGGTYTTTAYISFGGQTLNFYTQTDGAQGSGVDETETYKFIRYNSTHFNYYKDNVLQGRVSLSNNVITLYSYVSANYLSTCGGSLSAKSELFYVYQNNESRYYNITNATIEIYHNNGTLFNSTTKNYSGNISNISSFTINNLSIGGYYWNVLGCMNNGSDSICSYNNNNYSLTRGLGINSVSYNSTTVSQSKEYFYLNASIDISTYESATGVFYYNGTRYTSSSSIIDSNLILSNNLNVPVFDYTANLSFYWEITLNDGTTTTLINSSTYYQEINKVMISLCNSTNNVTFINFTVKNSENTTQLINSKFKATFNYGNYNFSYSDQSETKSSFGFCFNPPDETYEIDATIEYEATDYSLNFYYLIDSTLSNNTQNITLYLLNSSQATLTEYEVIDEGKNPLSNRYIQIQKYDIGTDTFYTVSMIKTGDEGKDLSYLNWYDTFYREIVTYESEVVKQTSSHKISETPQVIEIKEAITYEYDKFDNIVYSLTFNNATGNFVLTYTLPSGEVTDACLRVIRRSLDNDTTICDTCQQSSSATIYCNINAYGNGTYIATFYAKGSISYIDLLDTIVGSANRIYDIIGNLNGSIYALFLSILVIIMFLLSPGLGVLGAVSGLWLSTAFGFLPIDYITLSIITIAGLFLTWLLMR